MAGGKETPRQKMIGMMYLVLTALLALNVSKQIVAAFVTLNNKLDNSAEIIDIKSKDAYGQIENKRVSLLAIGGDTEELDYWNEKANVLKNETAEIVGFILGECNAMISESEGVDWVQQKDEAGNITRLKPLEEIAGMDNYDIPTNMFVGGNPKSPNERGQALVNKIHEYRNSLTTTMGTYEKGGKQYSFIAPDNNQGLAEALLTANEDDTAAIAQMYRTLTIPDELHAHGEEEMLPWVSVTFDHTPIVAAAAMFTSLKLDIKNAEANAATYYADKIDAPIFTFNKIEPMTLAPTQYINQNDSLPLRIAVAAYDTTDMAVIRYGIDSDTLPENWTETTGMVNLSGKQPGAHRVKGVIGIQERGERKWKPWEFDYTVGQPMGVVAQPEMRVLYWGYDNVIEATGSGFANENISISTQNCRIEQRGGKKIVKVSRGTREATVGVVGRNDDGSTMSLGSFKFKCVPLPSPELNIDGAKNGSTVQYIQAKNFKKVRLAYDESITLTGVNFKITRGQLRVDGVNRVVNIGEDGVIPSSASSILNQCRGKSISGEVSYRDPSGITKIEAFTYKVR